MTNAIGLDTVYKQFNDITRLLDRHNKRLDDMVGSSARLYSRVRDVAETVDRLNSRLDLIEESQSASGVKLDDLMGLLRKEP